MRKVTGDYRKSLQQLSQRLGLKRFLDWWLGELSAMVPRVFSGAAQTAMERRTLVTISGSRVSFSRVEAGKATEPGWLEMAALDMAEQKRVFQAEISKMRLQSEVALCLPSEQVLRKIIHLPLAAEENLRQVIAFEMDRYTPFKAEQVYFDFRLVHRDGQLEISLAVVPRAVVDDPLRQLAAWGAQVSAVLVADDVAGLVPWNLLPAEQRQKSRDTRQLRLNIALASGAAVLLCAALALPIWQKRETVLALHPLLAKAYQRAMTAEDLRHQLEVMMAEYNYLLDKKRQTPPVVAVLDDVTRALPDDTWIQQFDLKGKEILIQGETASSSKLAGLFEQAKTLHGASFRSPLTKGQGTNSERFQLAAETRPLPRAETEPPTLVPPAVVAPAPVTAPNSGEKTAPAVKDTPAAQVKDLAGKPQFAASETAKTDVKPAPVKTDTRPIPAPSTHSGGKP